MPPKQSIFIISSKRYCITGTALFFVFASFLHTKTDNPDETGPEPAPPKSTLEKDFGQVLILSPSGLQKCLIFIVGVIKNKKSRVPEKAQKYTSHSFRFWRPLGSKITQHPLRKGLQKSSKTDVPKVTKKYQKKLPKWGEEIEENPLVGLLFEPWGPTWAPKGANYGKSTIFC